MTVRKTSWCTILAVLSMLTLQGCAASLSGSVSRFHALTGAPQSFVIIPEKDQTESLEFKSYANLVSDALRARGWNEATIENSEVAVMFQYGISSGRQVVFSYPVLGQVPSGFSTTTSTITRFGSTANVQSITSQQMTPGVVGTGVGSRTVFDRSVRILMFSLPTFRSTAKMERIFEGQIHSTGSTGDLPTVMPALIKGLFEDFPGTSGTNQRLTIPLQ
jgi:hypothetical protein